ncbi:sulfite exporter TauE/SafE family protein [Pseudorhodoplanes sp.]|uniref:sulfite exporter TauE/SafE family protein n=1 Tax=Pseudorhodoplanes sp. TaxID=1934341 RepID=UPI002CA5C0FC|nr:sulfite exporter TauE/SafE family protein [Pseudorhodoplanes sp.]HWV52850.1 sulfite exporter TauE/SafE family protein [Pseudorhodoplanes sp.]
MPFDVPTLLTTLAVALPTIAIAYIIFGIAGFGTALIAAPVLAQVMPVASIVPMLALLDCTAAIINGVKLNDKIARREMMWLVPLLIAGSLVGGYLLLIIPARPMMLALGIFVVAYAIWSLVSPTFKGRLNQLWVIPFGAIGGIFSAMFGSGGFIYAIYLSRRLEDKDALRATVSVLIALAALTRLVIFALAGLYTTLELPLMALCLVPAMLLGLYAGHRITLKMSREQFIRVLSMVLIVTGTTLVVRALMMG